MAGFSGHDRYRFPRTNWRIRINKEQYTEFDLLTLIPIPYYPIPEELEAVLKGKLQPYPGISEKSLEWLDSVKVLSEIKYVNAKYLSTLKLLLYLEEYYSEKSQKNFIYTKIDRVNCSLTLNYFKFEIPPKLRNQNFQEYIMLDDPVEVQAVANRTKYILFVKSVEDPNFVIVRATSEFLNAYQKESLYIVKLQCSNWPIRACHYAISLIDEVKLSPILHPIPITEVRSQPCAVSTWFDNNITRNEEQMQAVQKILARTACPSPYLVFGPPGTGKTAVIIEAISQISKILKLNILVCTPSNAAADEITKRLIPNIGFKLICRLNSNSRDRKDIDRSISICSYSLLRRNMVMRKKIFIMTLVTCTRLVRTDFFRNYFSYIFIDEAGQATQPETLIPLGLTTTTGYDGYLKGINAQLILSGDPKQLGPVVITKVGQHLLGESMLERLMDRVELYQRDKDSKYNPNFLTKLVKNYRSHEAILHIPNQMFYENELVACGGKEIFRAENWWTLPNKKFPLIFHAVHGFEKRDWKSPSVYNPLEVIVVVKYVSQLMRKTYKHKIEEKDIGIVSPFKSQGAMIKKALERKGWHNISVGTVEIFQGQEKKIIIVSTVRSALFQHDGKFHIGFLSQEKRFNVTITRAKCLLIVVGNPKVLQMDTCWLEFIKYCEKNEACKGDKFSLGEMCEDEMNNLLNEKLQIKEKKKPFKAEGKIKTFEKKIDCDSKGGILIFEEMFKFFNLGESSSYEFPD